MDNARKNRPFRILCVACRASLYTYHGDFKGRFDWENFKPATSGVSPPRKFQKMVCPQCGKAWYAVTLRGKLLVMTDRGWRPSEPVGVPKIVNPDDARLTVDYQASDLDYIDPMSR